jgi:hypothetical protein
VAKFPPAQKENVVSKNAAEADEGYLCWKAWGVEPLNEFGFPKCHRLVSSSPLTKPPVRGLLTALELIHSKSSLLRRWHLFASAFLFSAAGIFCRDFTLAPDKMQFRFQHRQNP